MVKDENSTTRRNMIHTNCLLVLFIFIRTLLLFLSIISISAMHRTLRPGPGAQLNGSRKYTKFTPDIRSLHFSTFCLCFAWRSSTSAQSITLTLRQCSVAEQIERIDHTDNRASSSNAFSELIMCSWTQNVWFPIHLLYYLVMPASTKNLRILLVLWPFAVAPDCLLPIVSANLLCLRMLMPSPLLFYLCVPKRCRNARIPHKGRNTSIEW